MYLCANVSFQKKESFYLLAFFRRLHNSTISITNTRLWLIKQFDMLQIHFLSKLPLAFKLTAININILQVIGVLEKRYYC